MKKNITITAGLALALSLFTIANSNAQLKSEPSVKVIPAFEKGTLKVIYAHNPIQDVEVKFFSSEGLVLIDKIKSRAGQKGFIKNYDMSQLEAGSFVVEINSPGLSVTYKLELTRDGKTTLPVLQTTTYQHALLASN
jgi:hypothetical protein